MGIQTISADLAMRFQLDFTFGELVIASLTDNRVDVEEILIDGNKRWVWIQGSRVGWWNSDENLEVYSFDRGNVQEKKIVVGEIEYQIDGLSW
jgi:hypothetical protein